VSRNNTEALITIYYSEEKGYIIKVEAEHALEPVEDIHGNVKDWIIDIE